jgi:hypothetical protein
VYNRVDVEDRLSIDEVSPKRSRLVAVQSARQLVFAERIRIASLEPAVRDMGDHWAVVFDLMIPEGEVWDPSAVIVHVDKASGCAKLFDSL